MELFGLIFSVPFIFVSSCLYLSFLKRIISFMPWITGIFLIPSIFIIILLVLEIIGVATVGTLNLRSFIGPIFYKIHTVIFFLAVPSLSNVMQLQKKFPILHNKLGIALVCTVYGLVVVLLQIGVAETLYGIDGNNGSFSSEPHDIKDMF